MLVKRFGLSYCRGSWLAAAVLVLVASATPILASMRVDPVHEMGRGDSTFEIAIVTDIHHDTVRLHEELDTIVGRINNGERILLVMVTGDFAGNGAEPEHWRDDIACLDASLPVPWVPLIGNHDMVHYWWDEGEGRWVEDETLTVGDLRFETRNFQDTFERIYQRLEALDGLPGSPINDFRRYVGPTWNFEMRDWTDPQLGDLHGNDYYQDFAFRAGPTYCPYRFLCLDFNTRQHAMPLDSSDAGYGDGPNLDWNPGVNPMADLHHLPLWVPGPPAHSTVSSIDVVTGNGGICAYAYEDTGYNGTPLAIETSLASMPDGWNDAIRSIEVMQDCELRVYDCAGFEGDTWLKVTSPGDRDLAINGPAQWWHRELEDYAQNAPENQNDLVIIFAHDAPALDGTIDAVGGFDQGDHENLANYLVNYQNQVGGWFAGHITPDTLTWKYGILPAYVHSVAQFNQGIAPFDRHICNRWIVPPTGGGDARDGCVKFVKLRYSPDFTIPPPPVVDIDRSGVIPPLVDYTVVPGTQ
jgi:hypothetical protein